MPVAVSAFGEEQLKDTADYLWEIALGIEDGDLSLAERRLRDAFGLAHAVVVDVEDLPPLYAAATVTAYASFYEGYGLPPVEAMACGGAVVASAVGALPQVVGDGATLVHGHDEDDWVRALEPLVRDDSARTELVAAGTAEALGALAESAPARARVIPLKVAGAFHTEHMRPAVDDLAAHVAGLSPSDPRLPLLSNRDGEAVESGTDVLARIVDQVTRPVRWDLCMATMATRQVTGVLELLPGGTLTGLAKRGLKGTAQLAVKTPEDLDAARAFLAEHSA